MKVIKIIVLETKQILISEIEEVTSELGEPDCKLIRPFLVKHNDLNPQSKYLEPFLSGYTSQKDMMMSSDKILTLVEPTSELLEKYENLVKE